MKKLFFASIIALLFTSVTTANTGYFAGSGQTITLAKTQDIQLVEEEVIITPKCAWNKESDSVGYRCKFVLKNLSKKPVKAQVGFPLDSEFVYRDSIYIGYGKPKTLDLVLGYHFIARDENDTYHVRYVHNDTQRKLSHIFLWDMEFKPEETKTLHVTYELQMSVAATSTCKDELLKSGNAFNVEKIWHASLETCIVEWFQYVTETGKSWAGPIEKATFRVEVESLVSCLNKRPLLPPEFEPPIPRPEVPGGWGDPMNIPVKMGPLYQDISLQGGKRDPDYGTITWEYKNYKPGPPLRFMFYIVSLPRTAADCDYWVLHVLGRKPKKADVLEMREIAAAFYGIAPKSESAKRFVERQKWYHPKKDLQEKQLTDEQQAVLKRLTAIAQKAK